MVFEKDGIYYDENNGYTLDRKCIYQGIEYKIIEVLSSNNLLVIPLSDCESGKFPIAPLVIPGK